MITIEISTSIGCRVNCSYCPQSTLLANYNSSKTLMTLDDFKLILSNLDGSLNLIFSGFCENFQNRELSDMIIYASKRADTTIALWTTFQEMTAVDLTKLHTNNVELDYLGVHRLESSYYTEESFDDTLKSFLTSVKVKKYNIYDINPNEYIFSRASNLKDKTVNYTKGPIKCTWYIDNLNYNVVLPNGDIVLCCMDYSLKHKLGNLYKEPYNSNNIIAKRQQLQHLMRQEDSDILCRKCELSSKMIKSI